MLALYRAGRQSEALDAYREARQALIEQIGVEPGPELNACRSRSSPRTRASTRRRRSSSCRMQLEGGSPLLAGRERELGWLRKRWEEASEGQVVFVLVWGPAGIGKTRLVAELAAEVHGDGAAVLYTGGGEARRGRPGDRRRGRHRPPTDAAGARLRRRRPLERARGRRGAGPRARGPLARDLRPSSRRAGSARLRRPAWKRRRPAPATRSAVRGRDRRDRGALRPRRGCHDAASGADRGERRGAASHPPGGRRVGAGRCGRAARGHCRPGHGRAARSSHDPGRARRRRRRSADGPRANRVYAVDELAEASAPEVCPFRGLAPFDAAHAEYFFGRERLVAELVARLVGSTLLAVVGPSGSGKSSAVRAGLLPALADGVVPGSESWRRAVMRPGERPLAELSRALARAVPEAGAEDAAPVDRRRP